MHLLHDGQELGYNKDSYKIGPFGLIPLLGPATKFTTLRPQSAPQAG